MTAANGTYSLTGVPATTAADPYVFSVTPADDTAAYDFYDHPLAPTALNAGQNLTAENTHLVASGSVSGTVTSQGAPLADASIQVYDPNSYDNGNPPSGSASTDGSGHYLVTGLAPAVRTPPSSTAPVSPPCTGTTR